MKDKNMVELLAPAGDMECFYAAIGQGADAVYLGGKQFGARAYAGNFSDEEILTAIQTCHLLHKKLYMTVNTLLKEEEIHKLTDYLRPFYEAGLHGVIIQDFGVLRVLKESFPSLELHASTQMTLTGPNGCELLKKHRVTRVVPARELSLEEIKRIKSETGLEVEVFIHGAMCYGYSGQCMYSSMLGSRSGNRGRCAGPCRLPYEAYYENKQLNNKDSLYQLSLKDLCSLEEIPNLIEAGIDSFKIEGRMKSKEYVAFVTGMYRKYIDAYYKNPKGYKVDPKDVTLLQTHFCRGSLESGYFHTHNGAKLVTLNKPGYQNFDKEQSDSLQMEISGNGLSGDNKVKLTGYFEASKSAQMTLTVIMNQSVSYTVYRDDVQIAQKRASTAEDVKKNLNKTGNTPFVFEELFIQMEDDLFLPNQVINEMRREALDGLLSVYLADFIRSDARIMAKETKAASSKRQVKSPVNKKLVVELESPWQVSGIQLSDSVGKLVLGYDLVYAYLDEKNTDYVFESLKLFINELKEKSVKVFLALLPVHRYLATKWLEKHIEKIKELSFDGYVINNLESLAFVKNNDLNGQLLSNSKFYVMQGQALEFMEQEEIYDHFLSYELNQYEIGDLIHQNTHHAFYMPVYGYVPLMESAGCVLKTNHVCQKVNSVCYLKDRKDKKLTVLTHCDRCENTIYNAYPLSLHKEMKKLRSMELDGIVLHFTFENTKKVNEMIRIFDRLYHEADLEVYEEMVQTINRLLPDFTKGHFIKSVE